MHRTDTPDGPVARPLAAAAMAVYALVAVGAATSLLDGATACPTWPACEGGLAAALADPGVAVALAHRAAAAVAAALLTAALVAAWRRGADPRVRAAVAAAAALYPVQVGLGALAATGGASTALAAVHLVVALAIFAGLVAALAWHLDATGGDDGAAVDGPAAGVATANGGLASDGPLAAGFAGPGAVGADAGDEPRTTTLTDGSPGAGFDTRAGFDSHRERAAAYLALTKPRLTWLLCLVALAAMGLAGGRSVAPGTVVATLAGGVLAVGASGTFNNVLERDVDRYMERTADRPVTAGRVPPRRAAAFGGLLAVASAAVFVAFVNVLAAALGLLAILFYSVGYTLVLKPRTDQNVVVGGAVGAFPALIGWAAVTETVGLPAVALGAVVFLWTPAHFYNLALVYADDYARAGFPMLPVVRGAAAARRHVLGYLGATFVGAAALGTAGALGLLYAVTGVAVGGVFLWAVLALHRERTDRAAMRTFHASNAYLGALLLAVVADTMVV